jgi:hypothetical protein
MHGPKRVYWFVEKRDEALPYEAFIFAYDPERAEVIAKALKEHGYLEGEESTQAQNMDALNECFTEEVIEKFKEYLKDETLHVEEIGLPLYDSASGYGWDCNHERYIDLDKEPGYDLPFSVRGVIFLD